MKKTIAFLGASFAAAVLVSACGAPPRRFSDLTEAEKIQFTTCVTDAVAKAKIIDNKTGTIGGAIDSIIDAPKRMLEISERAARGCASSMNIDPATVPGLRP